MTNEELKKKIEGILQEEIEYVVVCGSSVKNVCIEHIADALIAAGIRDMSDIRSLADNVMLSVIAHKAEVSSMEQRTKEAEHRAARAERALYKACKDIKDICEYLVKVGGTGVITIESYAPEQSEPSAYIDRAEKELAEEGKDGNETD